MCISDRSLIVWLVKLSIYMPRHQVRIVFVLRICCSNDYMDIVRVGNTSRHILVIVCIIFSWKRSQLFFTNWERTLCSPVFGCHNKLFVSLLYFRTYIDHLSMWSIWLSQQIHAFNLWHRHITNSKICIQDIIGLIWFSPNRNYVSIS